MRTEHRSTLRVCANVLNAQILRVPKDTSEASGPPKSSKGPPFEVYTIEVYTISRTLASSRSSVNVEPEPV